MAPKRPRKEPALRARARSSGLREWVGGRVSPPFFVMEGEPFRPELIVWMELPEGLVVGHHLQDPKAPVEFGVTFEGATQHPLVGPARRPARIRVATQDLAESIRRVASPELEIAVAPTPELDAVVEAMKRAPRDDAPDDSYLEHGRVSPDAVAKMFRAAELVYRLAPWKTMGDEQVVRVDIPRLGVQGGCLSVIGGEGESFGLILFPSLAGFESFAATAPGVELGPVDFGTTLLSMTFERGSDVPASMRREVGRHGWPVAAASAYPVVVHRDADGVPRPLSGRDYQVMSACSTALGAFLLKNGAAFVDDEGPPISESYVDGDDLAVRLTYPFEAFKLFDDDAPEGADGSEPVRAEPRVARNAPCPCGSGKKYKKCHLASDEAGAREAAGPPSVHEIDERMVVDMQRFAARRFPGVWQTAIDVFEDFEREIQLASPWSVYGANVEGRPIVDWYLDERRPRLSTDERSWLEAQQQSWLTVWGVVDVDPGRGLPARDLLTGEERDVTEVKGSRVLVKRDAVLGRVVDHDGVSVFCGMHPNPLPPRAAADLVRKARAKLRRKTAVPVARLRDDGIGRYLIARWEEAVEAMWERANVPPRLTNTDGDELKLTADLFSFSPANRRAVEASLQALEGVEPADDAGSQYVFLRGAATARAAEGATVIGRATLEEGGLRVETNSGERADALRARIERACPDLLAHVRRDQTAPLAPRLAGPPARTSEGAASPDAGEAVRDFKRQHYREWADRPVPALRGKTPREAMRTLEGRQAVDALLKDFENHEQRAPSEVRFDFAELRKDLGLPQ